VTAPGDLHIVATPALLAETLADAFAAAARDAVAARDAFTVALAGGNTPRDAYRLLAQEPRRSDVTWSAVHVYFGDERCVGPNEPQSNYRMARDAFLDAVGIPDTQIHRMRGEIPPAQAALDYAQTIRDRFGSTPQFDLVMLGIGADGHTASLFPGEDPRTDDDALVRAVYSQPARMWRITVTPKVINAAREVIVGVAGREKSAALKAVREGPYDPTRYPAQIVKPVAGRLLWLVDAASAGGAA
jgi:6-phosphogluconolactonase